jgi:hypothetical protein
MALINILRRHSGDCPLVIQNCNNPNLCWIKQFEQEGMKNALTYDFEKQLAFGVSTEWYDILEEVKKLRAKENIQILDINALKEEDWRLIYGEKEETVEIPKFDQDKEELMKAWEETICEREQAAVSRESIAQ